jgi:hypothetical protein
MVEAKPLCCVSLLVIHVDDQVSRLAPRFDAPVRFGRLSHGKALIDDGF